MKDEYLFLYHWKRQGFDQFPQIPIDVIQKSFDPVKLFLASAKESHPDLYQILTQENPSRWDFELIIWPLAQKLAQEGPRIIQKSWVDAEWGEQIVELGRMALAARQSIIQGHDRQRIVDKFCKSTFPKLQGGAIIPTENQKVILKRIHEELCDCIKFVRRQAEIPLTLREQFPWGQDEDELIKFRQECIKDVPGISDLFLDKEIPFFTKYSSIATTAYEIVSQRLFESRNGISGSTLKDNLCNINLPSFLTWK